MGLLQIFKNAVYSFVTRYQILFYIFPVVAPFMKKKFLNDAKKNCNHLITDKKGHTIKVTKFNDRIYPSFGVERLSTIPDIPIRKDDVMLCGYQKTGCHWVHEILYMLVNGKAEISKYGKGVCMMDITQNIVLDSLPSPRVLNSHLFYDQLPKGIRANRNKIILTVRNPKDTIVSYFNHVKNLHEFYGYNGEFDDFFDLFMDSKLEYGSYFDYYLSWDKLLKNPGSQSILLLKFEDNKADPIGCVKRIAKFLDLDIADEMATAIVEKTNFSKMKEQRSKTMESVMFRKGKVGDWHNWLSEAQSRAIDTVWQQKMTDCQYQPEYQN